MIEVTELNAFLARKRKRVEARTSFEFSITPLDVKIAKCGDPAACAIAQGILHSMPQGIDIYVQVGGHTTKVYSPDAVTLYRTPEALRRAVRKFDLTGVWEIKPGRYKLYSYTPTKNRQHLRKPNPKKGNMSKFRARATRRVLRLGQELSAS